MEIFRISSISLIFVAFVFGSVGPKEDQGLSMRLLEVAYKCHYSGDSKDIVDRVYNMSPEKVDKMLALEEPKNEEEFFKFIDKISTPAGNDLVPIFNSTKAGVLLSEGNGYVAKVQSRLQSMLVGTDEGKKRSAEALVKVAEAIHNAWKVLCVKLKKQNDTTYSTLIFVKNPFVIPGGRFRECYYWDTYWVIEGLLGCGMHSMAIGIVENFIDLINKYGFIPNGIRTYYLNRSQPPYFPHMLVSIYRSIPLGKVRHVLINGLEAAKKEHKFFMDRRSEKIEIKGETHVLNLYRVITRTPRAESYIEDRNLAEECKSVRPAEDVWTDLKSGAESGLDYTTRWMTDGENFHTINTSKIIPVDLNGIMYANELIISRLSEALSSGPGKNDDVRKFKDLSEKRRKAINAVLWNSKEGVWNDYHITLKKHTSPGFYFSNMVPMCYGISPQGDVTVYDILNKYAEEIFGREGGMPTSGISKKSSNQQWDYPNVWPPLVHTMALFLERICEREMAVHVAKALVNDVVISTSRPQSKGIFEKYDCEMAGSSGHKGEYAPQVGFGWTNGAVVHFLDIFLDDIILKTGSHEESYKNIKGILAERIKKKDKPKNYSPETCLPLSAFESGEKSRHEKDCHSL